MKFLAMALFSIFLTILTGCVSPGKTTANFMESNAYTVKNEQYYEMKPEKAWDILVRELSKSFFMINNIDKESRIINVSYSSNEPCKYVDCGSMHIDVQKSSINKAGLSSYDLQICDSNSFISEGSSPNNSGIPSPIICQNSRRPKLEGRMNIYVAPEGQGTLVTVNSRYVLDIKLLSQCDYYAPAGNFVTSGHNQDSYQCSFDSKKPELCQPVKGEPFMCYSKGTLEGEILSLIPL